MSGSAARFTGGRADGEPWPRLAPIGAAITRGGRGVGAARELWAAIPPVMSQRMRPMSADLVREVVGEIKVAVPAYAALAEEGDPDVLVRSVEMAIVHCFDNICDPRATLSDWEAAFRYAGRVEHAQGRTMDALQTAVRVGARVAWRRMRVVGRELGVPTDTLLGLADRVFAYVDELCAVAIQGYTDAQAHATGALERRRRQLLKLVLAAPAVSPHSLRDLAGTTDWPLPERVAVVAVEYRADGHLLPPPSLGPDVLVDLESHEPCLLLADPDRVPRGLAGGLPGRRLVLGPTVALGEARRSLACARRALALVQRGVIPDTGLVRCDDHLTALVLLSDEFLLARVTDRALAPFAGLTAKQRERLTATLLAWLETRGGINEIAHRLDVHPQTVRYRMHQLDELLGDRLDDPTERLAMEIALRGRALLDSAMADPALTTPKPPEDDDEPLPRSG